VVQRHPQYVANNVHRSRHTPLHTVKVVITGQDPYHGPNQAHGLSFSVRPPTPAPPSLANIYKALKKDYPDYQPPPNKGGLLTPWADRGVLLLNTCLTVRRSEANSHSGKGWELLTRKVIDTVVKVRTHGVVFLAWGTPAQKGTAGIPVDKHLILKSVHPSPLSAMRGFVRSVHLSQIFLLIEPSSIAITSPKPTSGWYSAMARMALLIGI
jgi:uracil-DNA glycosylase